MEGAPLIAEPAELADALEHGSESGRSPNRNPGAGFCAQAALPIKPAGEGGAATLVSCGVLCPPSPANEARRRCDRACPWSSAR